jgi:site-specific recombinase XerD
MNVPLPTGPSMFHLAEAEESRKVLRSAGFVETETIEVPIEFRCDDPDYVLELLYKSGARIRALLELQSPEVKERVDRAILEGAERHRRDGEIVLTMTALMASGRKSE